jgi:uncharacterized protein YecT (DUF1311 family)
MKNITALLIVFASASAFSKNICNDQANVEITGCVQKNYRYADNDLNSAYDNVLGKISSSSKKSLIATQRAWIAYKDKYCNLAFEATAPGAEAPIDKWSCLTSVTETRENEIRYFYSSIGMDDFRRSLVVMANLYENGDASRVLSKLVKNTPDRDNPDWLKYVNLNCKMTSEKLQEDRETCIARLNFYKNW